MLTSNEEKNCCYENPPVEGGTVYKSDDLSNYKTVSPQTSNTPHKNPFHLHNFNSDVPPEMLQSSPTRQNTSLMQLTFKKLSPISKMFRRSNCGENHQLSHFSPSIQQHFVTDKQHNSSIKNRILSSISRSQIAASLLKLRSPSRNDQQSNKNVTPKSPALWSKYYEFNDSKTD